MDSLIRFLQRSETIADTPSFEEIETVPDMSPHPDQTRAEAPIGAVQNQDHRHELPPTHGYFSSFPQQPHRRGTRGETLHQTRRYVGGRQEFCVE